MWALKITIALLIFTILDNRVQSCELDKMGNGCRITNGACSCGYGCKAEYRYATMEECKLALRGGRHNSCLLSRRHGTSRCLNDGTCLQITSDPGFKCLCEGTGFFGIRCEKPCPGPENPHHRGPFPYECVVI